MMRMMIRWTSSDRIIYFPWVLGICLGILTILGLDINQDLESRYVVGDKDPTLLEYHTQISSDMGDKRCITCQIIQELSFPSSFDFCFPI